MIHILVFRRPNIESADHPLNTGSKSNLQDFLDKRLIKLFLISIYFFSSRNKTSRRKPEKDTRIREFKKISAPMMERVRKIRPPAIVGAREQLIRALTTMAPSIMGWKALMNASCPDREGHRPALFPSRVSLRGARCLADHARENRHDAVHGVQLVLGLR